MKPPRAGLEDHAAAHRRTTGRLCAFLRCLVLCCVTALILAAPSRAEDGAGFIAGITDLPIMPGLHEVPEAGVVFDKPAGRIVEAYAEGAVSPADVLDFYGTTLPQLGWDKVADSSFRRDGERLVLKLRKDPGGVVVRFMLSPE